MTASNDAPGARPPAHRRPSRALSRIPLLFSIIIPAFNEAKVIARCLSALVDGRKRGEGEVLVVCNGCSDNTAQIARSFGAPVRVIETSVPSKTHALNLGDQAARGFPRIYLDADVVIDLVSVRAIVASLEKGPAIAAAPRPITVFLPDTSWAVRAYYRFWLELPYIQEGMITAGVYALSKAGRRRFEAFPDLIADDGYVRLLFEPRERTQVADATSEVLAPASLSDLIKIKTRARLGVLQLRARYPELSARETRSKNHRAAFLSLLAKPTLYPDLAPYAYVILASRLRARRQFRKIEGYVWERDNSSRTLTAEST